MTDITAGRGDDIAADVFDPKKLSKTLEKTDTSIINHIKKKIRPTIERNGKSIIVPVIYGNPEKWKSSQEDGVLKDSKGRAQTPLIMVKRTGFSKNKERFSPVNKYLSRTFETGWNKRTAYDKFNVLNGIVPTKERFDVTMPDCVDITYEITIWTELITDLNTITEAISFEDDEFWGEGQERFKVSIESFTDTLEAPSTEDRIVKSMFSLTVQAYLLPENMVKGENIVSTTKKHFSPKKIVFTSEVVIKVD